MRQEPNCFFHIFSTELKEGAVPEVDGGSQVLFSVEFCTSWHKLRPTSFTINWNINLRTRDSPLRRGYHWYPINKILNENQ